MKCLCCGKPITNSATNVEKEWCWHKKCVKRFFQTDELPILDITKEQLEILANETVNEGLTVPGVQKKLSLHLSTDLNARLTIVDYPTGYILKPQTEEFDNMPEFEDLAMRLAEIMGIQTVPHALIKMNDEYAYITKEQLEILANEIVNEGLTVPGVQKKLSLHLSTDLNARLTIVDYPTGYILKPQTEEFDNMPEFEDLAMRLAEIMGIQTVPHALIKMNDEYAYITKRIDREISEKETKLYAMEDFCQLSYRLTQDKYKCSYEQCGRIIKKCSATPGLDLSELFLRVVGSFVMGNSDMHLKNFSLKETEPGSRNFQLSKAYDMLPVNVIMPEDKEQLALTINGKKRNIHKKEFRILAESCGIPLNSAERMMKKVCSLKAKLFTQIEESCLSAEQKEQMEELISKRLDILS